MACQLPEAISKIEEILSKNVEGIASAMLSGSEIKILNEAKNNLQSAIEIRMSRMQSNNSGSESIDSTKKDFRSEFKNKRPSAAKWVDKEVAKFDVATQAISDGTNSSTAGFVKDFYGDKANTGKYTKDDVVYLSTNGNRTGRVIPVKNGALQGAYKNIDKAIEAGAKFVADTSKHLVNTGKYNVGEVELAEYLQSKGYTRDDKDGYGLWSTGKAKEVVSDNTDDYIMNARQVKEYHDADYDESTGGYLTGHHLDVSSVGRKKLSEHFLNIKEEAYSQLWFALAGFIHNKGSGIIFTDLDKISKSLIKYGFSDKDISNLKKFQVELGLTQNKQQYPIDVVLQKLSKEASKFSRTGKYKYADAILSSVDARELLTRLSGVDFSKDDKSDNKPLDPEIKYGSVVKYKPENGIEGYYVVRGFSANGGLQLTDGEGKNFSGTPNVDKVKFVKQLEIKTYNKVDYIIDSNNRIYTSNGEVTSKNYVDRLLNEFGISKENKQEDKQNETVYEIAERAIIDKINKLKNNHTSFGNDYNEYMINLEKFLDKLLTEGLKSGVTINYSKETAFKFMNTGVAGSFIPKNNLIVLPDFDSLLSDKDLMDKLIKPYTKNKDIDYEFISGFLDTKIGNIDNDHKLSSLIHERVHSVVSKWLFDENNEDHEYMYEINDLFNIAKNKFEKLTKHEQDKIGHYWKKDIHEFAAEGLASKSLVEFLRNIETESSSNRSGVKTTLLDELFAIVSKIYKNTTGKNLHNSLLTVIVKIAENENDIESFSKYQSNLAATEAYTSNASLVKIGSAREYGIYLRENYTDVYTHVGEVFDKYDKNKTITDRKQFGNHLYVSDLAWSSYWKAYRASVLDNKMEEWSKELGLDSLIDYNWIKEKHKSEYEILSKNTISYFAIKDKNPIEIKSKKDLSSEELKDIYSKSPSSITEIGGINPYNDLIGGIKQKAILGDYVRLGSSEDIKNFKEFVKEYRDNDIVYLSDKSYNPQSEADVYNNKYKTISKDDIDAAKDIMSNNKKECE